jgi:hypothetical protein
MKGQTFGSVAGVVATILVSAYGFAQPAAPPPTAPQTPVDDGPAQPGPEAPSPPAAPTPAPAPPKPAPLGAGISPRAFDTPQADTGEKKTQAEEAEERGKQLRWHGSIFFLDQSVSSQTIGIGSDYQGSNSVYELWYSFRPRYYLYEAEADAVYLSGRFDLFQELTDSDVTTRKREPVFGDSWINGVYEHWFVQDEATGYGTRVSGGPRLILGTSKTSRAVGTRFQIGGGGAVKQILPIRGPKRDSFQTIALTGSAYYTKYVNRCTTPCDASFSNARQDSGGRALVSDQISGAALVNHQIIASLGSELDIVEKLSFNASLIWVMQWLYPLSDQGSPIVIATGPVQPEGSSDPQSFRVSPWLLTSVDYSLMDEVDVALGYYNYTNQIGPDGQRRSPLWSPDARFFLTITANLDAIYETATGRSHQPESLKTAQRRSPISTNF